MSDLARSTSVSSWTSSNQSRGSTASFEEGRATYRGASATDHRATATRWTRDQLANRVAESPEFVYDSPSPEHLTELVRAYERITRDPVRSLRKRNLIASAYRVRGPSLLDFIANGFAAQGSATNLLGLARTTTARFDRPAHRSTARSTPAPIRDSSTGVQDHDGLPCPDGLCLPSVIYCAHHCPPFDGKSRRRYDRRRTAG